MNIGWYVIKFYIKPLVMLPTGIYFAMNTFLKWNLIALERKSDILLDSFLLDIKV
jgi:hypothetical protein